MKLKHIMILILALTMALPLTQVSARTCKEIGFTPGWWKNRGLRKGYWHTIGPSDELSEYFGDNAPDSTMIEALQGGGGKGVDGAKRILARAAVAALLNVRYSWNRPGEIYHYSNRRVMNMVENAFDSNNRATMINLAEDLDHWNNI